MSEPQSRKITHEDRRRALLAVLNREGKRIRITAGQRKAILNGSAYGHLGTISGYPDVERCTAVMVGRHPHEKEDRLFTCAQRRGHTGPHNERIPADGCTSWADHCAVCAEHVCVCQRDTND